MDYENLLSTVKERLKTRNVSAVHRGTGIAIHTIRFIANGKTKKPQIATLKTLNDFMEKH